ncbi:MAG TPA: S41 family peptidase [Longimicrobium sp.]|nr:S41 family peptidase [Longimicrobium sp.]
MPTHLPLRAPLLLALLLAAGCDSPARVTEAPDREPFIGAEARVYLDSALSIMQSRSLHRHEVSWPAFRATLLRRADGAQRPAQTHEALDAALRSLNRHSFLVPPGAVGNELAQTSDQPGGTVLLGRFGYVRTVSFSGQGDAHTQEYHDLIRGLDQPATCGWVVDLRFNGGGNMWPMLAGVGPILGEGSPGSFVDADGTRTPWYYENGASGTLREGLKLRAAGASAPHRLRREGGPVAVLTGPTTASAGEAVAIAFRGRPDARSFGTLTYGVPTANSTFPLSDGAIMVLTTAWEEDRNGVRYTTRMRPDEDTGAVTSVTANPAEDPTLARALEWLGAHAACQPPAGDS